MMDVLELMMNGRELVDMIELMDHIFTFEPMINILASVP